MSTNKKLTKKWEKKWVTVGNLKVFKWVPAKPKTGIELDINLENKEAAFAENIASSNESFVINNITPSFSRDTKRRKFFEETNDFLGIETNFTFQDETDLLNFDLTSPVSILE